MENNNSNIVSREKIDQVAFWLGSTLSSAFFSSLERFSCVNLATNEAEDDGEDEYADVDVEFDDAKSTVQVEAHNSKDIATLPVWEIILVPV